jgi:hypothetical protein
VPADGAQPGIVDQRVDAAPYRVGGEQAAVPHEAEQVTGGVPGRV